MSELKALRERVAAATGPDRVLDAEIAIEIGGFSRYRNWWDGPGRTNPAWHALANDVWVPLPAYTASLDLVLNLMGAKLPSVRVDLEGWTGTNQWGASMGVLPYLATGPTPALALLSALLAALDAEGGA
jgi:hypothetical protein